MGEIPPNMTLIAALFAALIAILLALRAIERQRPHPFWKKRKYFFSQSAYQRGGSNLRVVQNSPKIPDIQQVLTATFQKKRLMNGEEYGLFKQLERLVSRNTEGLRLFTQVSLGEILQSNDRDAFFSINSKRCDFLIIDKFGDALVVIEYHGSGHFQGDSSNRDEIKRLALKKASIPTVEVILGYKWIDVESELKKELGEVFSPI